MIKLTHNMVEEAAKRTAFHIAEYFGIKAGAHKMVAAFPIPRGGVAAAYMVAKHCPALYLVDCADDADCFIDDLVDSGRTRAAYAEKFEGKPFFALFDKTNPAQSFNDEAGVENPGWLVFPWEGGETSSAEDIPIRLLQYIGEDPTRGGLLETPARFLKAWRHWASGYGQNPADVLKVFEDGAEAVDEMVLVSNIPVNSKCEHHMADIFGLAHVAYIPNGKIVGLSKIPRLVDIFAHRLQVQERLTTNIADAIHEHLQPLGVGVVLQCRHRCIESRGVALHGTITTTSAMRGVFKTKPEARAEFLRLVEGARNGAII